MLHFLLMRRRPPRAKLTDTLFPDTTPSRSSARRERRRGQHRQAEQAVSQDRAARGIFPNDGFQAVRSEEHTSELQSLTRITYAVFCLKKKTQNIINQQHIQTHS